LIWFAKPAILVSVQLSLQGGSKYITHHIINTKLRIADSF